MRRSRHRSLLRAAAYIAAATLLAVPLMSCGGSTSPKAAPTPTTRSSPSAATPSTGAATEAVATGCDTPTAGGTTTLALSIDGQQRTVIVHVPSGYSGTEAVPLVLNMHGSGSTASGEEAFTGMDATADANQFIVAYPQGAIAAGSGFDWNVSGQPLIGGGAVPASAPDDVSFLTRLVTALGQRYCIDSNRVYATGFSGGARMASQLGCDAANVFAASAPVSGLRLPSPCPNTRPEPVLSFHGTADPVDPYNGNGQKYWTYSVPTAAQDWATRDNCAPTPAASQPEATVTLRTYTSCRGSSSVELYSITGEGHEWPGGPALSAALRKELGPQTTAINADTVMWAFFKKHTLS
ncbi:MAG: extracellular catalytic domain type 1 short-chain-length polyhydroxyalkanoate depolymerase [Tepidiformaceae bacterium]